MRTHVSKRCIHVNTCYFVNLKAEFMWPQSYSRKFHLKNKQYFLTINKNNNNDLVNICNDILHKSKKSIIIGI